MSDASVLRLDPHTVPRTHAPQAASSSPGTVSTPGSATGLAGFCTAFGSLPSHVIRWDPTETWGTVHDPHHGTWTALRAAAPTVFRTATPKVGTVSISLMPSRMRPWRGLPATVLVTPPKGPCRGLPSQPSGPSRTPTRPEPSQKPGALASSEANTDLGPAGRAPEAGRARPFR